MFDTTGSYFRLYFADGFGLLDYSREGPGASIKLGPHLTRGALFDGVVEGVDWEADELFSERQPDLCGIGPSSLFCASEAAIQLIRDFEPESRIARIGFVVPGCERWVVCPPVHAGFLDMERSLYSRIDRGEQFVLMLGKRNARPPAAYWFNAEEGDYTTGTVFASPEFKTAWEESGLTGIFFADGLE